MTDYLRISGPLKWHGGKYYIAPQIVSLMPPHIHYVEPFAGGLSVLFAKDPIGISEVVNDLNGDLTNFWDILKREQTFAQFLRIAEATPFSQVEWERSQELLKSRNAVERAIGFFIRCRQSQAGRMRSFAPITRNRTRRQMNEQASAWLNAIEGLPEVHARLKRVVILRQPALEVIKSHDGDNTLFYLDPPYMHDTRTTVYEYGEHEMTNEEHEHLVELLLSLKAKVIVSMYRHPLYDQLSTKFGWHLRQFDLPNNAAGGNQKRRMTECLWMNFIPNSSSSAA
jgi:DNA adenine methylase